jgi:hypothetical protein
MSKKEMSSIKNYSFVTSIYLPETTMCITSTSTGELVLWDVVAKEEEAPVPEGGADPALPVETSPLKSLVKTIHLCEGRISWLSTCDGRFLVVAGEDGCVRFYDFSMRIISWFEDLNAGPVTSVSFASSNASWQQQAPASDEEFVCPDFVVGTSTSCVRASEASASEEEERQQPTRAKRGRRGQSFCGVRSAAEAVSLSERKEALSFCGGTGSAGAKRTFPAAADSQSRSASAKTTIVAAAAAATSSAAEAGCFAPSLRSVAPPPVKPFACSPQSSLASCGANSLILPS